MSRLLSHRLALAGAIGIASFVAGCASKPPVVAVVPPPVLIAPPPAPMPAGGVPGMTIPARLADGRYPTPSRSPTGGPLSPDAALWHLRAALNVAALACRDPNSPIVASYNSLLTARRTTLAAAESHYAAEWKASGIADWRDGYDDAMTRVYNFYGQSFARAPFCAAAAASLAALAGAGEAELPAMAATQLAALDRPFTDFFAAYDAWRTGVAPQHPLIALAAPAPARPAQSPAPAPIPAATPAQTPTGTPSRTAVRPRLELDPSIFQLP